MRMYLVLIALVFLSAGCATSADYASQEPSAAQIEMRDKVLAEYEERTRAQQKTDTKREGQKTTEPENPWIQATKHVFEAQLEPTIGMTKAQFFKGRGMADKRELRNGEEVLWFDGDEPYFAVFKNKKLTSYYIDKETIARRADERRRQQEAYEQDQYEEQIRAENRRQGVLKAVQGMFKPQPMPYQIPVNKPVQTNCYMIGNQMYCTSY